MRNILSSFVLACFVLSGTSALAEGLTPKEKRSEVVDFELGDVKGKTVKLSSYKGKVVAISFWASWCEPCKQELKFLNQYKKDNPDKNFEIIAVATDAPETISKVKSIVKRKRWCRSSFEVLCGATQSRGIIAMLENGSSPTKRRQDGGRKYKHDQHSSDECSTGSSW